MDIAPRGDGDNAVSLLLIDETSRVPDQVYEALQPMLAVTDGDLWMMSMPRGRSGFRTTMSSRCGDEKVKT